MATWQTIARENLRMARLCERESGGERTACSRAYYAAFSAVTAYLDTTAAPNLYSSNQITPPHHKVRQLLAIYGDPARSGEIITHLAFLYKLRIEADYRNNVLISQEQAREATKIARRAMSRLGVS